MLQSNTQVAVVIPAYRPGAPLASLVDALLAGGAEGIVIIDDGSGPNFVELFEGMARRDGVHVLHHAVNLGKGAALKSGLNYTLTEIPGLLGVVSADADGQHDAEDILRIADLLRDHSGSLILGVRQWEERVPWKSRVGNLVTRILLRLMVGQKLSDTQTGLRGIPAALIPHLLRIPAQGYEFELDMLITCKHQAHPILEAPIRTIYLEENRGSHFRPVVDSMRIYFLLFRFGALSFLTAVLDNVVFVAAYGSTGSITQSQIAARLCAMTFNYLGARRMVFHSQQRHAVVLPKYVLLVAANGLVSYAFIRCLHDVLGWQPVPAKLVAEGLLFAASFVLQRDIVFTRQRNTGKARDRDANYAPAEPAAKLTRRYTTAVLLDAIRAHASAANGDGRLAIVEIGGANSRFLDSILAGIGCRSYDVVDTNERGLSVLAGKMEGSKVLRLHRQSVLDLHIRPQADLVFSVGLIEHFDPEETRKAVQAHFDVLRPGGVAIISFPTPTLLYRATRGFIELLGMWKFHAERPLARGEVTASVEECGDVLKSETLWPLLLTQELIVARKRANPRFKSAAV